MAEWRQSYSPEEDALILSYVKEAKDEKISIKTAYIKAADKLQRPVQSIANRYRTKLKDQVGGIDNLRGISDNERVILKLKSIANVAKRGKEKSEHWKDQYNEIQRKYKDLEKKYNQLSQEHQALIDTVNKALSEFETG